MCFWICMVRPVDRLARISMIPSMMCRVCFWMRIAGIKLLRFGENWQIDTQTVGLWVGMICLMSPFGLLRGIW